MSSRATKPRRRVASSAGKMRILHVIVPEDAHWQARMAAVASRLPFKTFMARLMLAATPLLPKDAGNEDSLSGPSSGRADTATKA